MYSFSAFEAAIKKLNEHLATALGSIRTGRAAPAILDNVQVESYGALTSISHLANISIEDPRTLRVAPWDMQNAKHIEKAIAAANLGLSVALDDKGVRISFPELTTERREMLVKLAKERLEETRMSLRSERDKIWKDIQEKEKAGTLSEDVKFRAKEQMEKMVATANAALEERYKQKEKNILQ